MHPVILFYNLENSKGRTLKMLCLRLKIKIRIITKEQYNQTHEVSLRDPEGKNYLNVYFPEAPLFGLWSAEKKNAPYAAIEPWFGRCDKEDFNGSLEEREWGHALAQGACFQAAYTIEIAGED